MLPATELGGGQREKGGLRQGVEGQREQRADQCHQAGMRDMAQAAEQAALDADRLDDFVRLGAQHGSEIHAAQRDEKSDGNDGPQRAEPRRHIPLAGQRRHAESDGHDHGTMPEGKQRAAITRQSRPGTGVVTGKAVDGRQVIGIKAVLHTEHEGQNQQRQPVSGQRVHEHLVRRI